MEVLEEVTEVMEETVEEIIKLWAKAFRVKDLVVP